MKKAFALFLVAVPVIAIACGGGVEESGANDESKTTSSSGSSGTSGYSSSGSSGTSGTVIREPKNHRATATQCAAGRNDSPPVVPDGGGVGPQVLCRTHAECTEGVNGRCTGNSHDGWQCTYDQCQSDVDCGAGQVCSCEGGFRSDANVCLAQSGCQVDADCGAGGWCSPTLGSCGNFAKTQSFQCHTPTDECVDDSDCTGEKGAFGGNPYCAYDQAVGHWKCSTSECAG